MAKSNFQITDHFAAAVSMDSVRGVSRYSTFGALNNPVADVPTDLSSLGVATIPLPLNIGEDLEIVSDDAGDTDTISITVLGPSGILRPTFTVVLTGTTPVPLPGLISRINGAASVGVNGFDGTLIIRQAGGGTTFANLLEDDQIMKQAHYTTPLGKGWTIESLVYTMVKAIGADSTAIFDVAYKAFENTKYLRPFPFGLQRNGDPSMELRNLVPSVIPGPTDIKITATAQSAGTVMSAFFSGFLFDI